MENQKKTAKKLMAIVLAVLMVISTIPIGVLTTAFASTTNCLAVKVCDKKVYFYGAETLEVNENKVKFTGGDTEKPSFYINGVESNDSDAIVLDDKTIEFNEKWIIENQPQWIALQCDTKSDVPQNEPSVEVDEEAPKVDVSGNPKAWTNEDVKLTVDATDSGTGVVAYSMDKINWYADSTFDVEENGIYTFYAKDAVGNISEGKEIEVSFIDKIAPTISSVAIDPDTWTNENVTLIVTANDEQSGLAAESYKMDDGEWQVSNEFVVSDSKSHTFYVKDAVENIAQTTQKADKHDVIKPEITKIEVKWKTITIDPDTFTSPIVNYDFYITAKDDKSGISEYSIDNTNWQTSNKFTLKGAENYTFYVKDNAGNVSEVTNYSLKKDITAPQINEITKSTSKPTNKPVTITIIATDNIDGSGLNDKAYALDDKNNWQKDNTFEIKDSNKHIVYVRDKAKPENIAEQEITVENFCDEIPTIDSVELSKNEWTNSMVVATVNGKGTTNAANAKFEIVEYKIDDSEWQSEKSFEINDCKSHEFYVKDSAGNISKAFEKAAINYDAKSPILNTGENGKDKAVCFEQINKGWLAKAANKLSFGIFFNERLKITVKAKDVHDEKNNASGIVSAEFVFVSADKQFEYTYEPQKIGNKTDNEIEFYVDKEHEVNNNELPENFKGTAKVILTDAADNKETFNVTTDNSDIEKESFMIENTPPEISELKPSIEASENSTFKENYVLTFNVDDNIGQGEYSGIAWVSIKVNGVEVANEGNIFNYTETSQTKLPNKEYKINVVGNDENDDYRHSVNGISFFDEDWNKGQLEFVVKVADNAGNVTQSEPVVYNFDQTAPSIKSFDIGKNKATAFVSGEDYGFYFKEETQITITAEDVANKAGNEAVASGLSTMTVYLKSVDDQDKNKDERTLYTVDEETKTIKEITSIEDAAVISIDDANPSVSFSIPKDFKGQIYAYATDKAGNSNNDCQFVIDDEKVVDQDGFVHPDGSIIETEAKHTDTSSIEFVSVPKAKGTQNTSSTYKYSSADTGTQQDETMDYVKKVGKGKVPLYNKDINFGVRVKDTYSGIRDITYTIIEGKEKTAKTVVVDNDGKISGEANGWSIEKKDNNLVTEMKNTIAVSGNYNDMVLLVELTDRAGNKSYDYYVFGIDKTAPTITVTYDNNSDDTQSGTGSYFKANRTATILVQERNFNTENVKFAIKNSEGEAPKVVDKGLATRDTTGNGDANVYKYVVTYSNDGVYTFNVEYTDRATNKASVDYKDSVAPKSFTIDKILPVISVSYDNNDAQNGKYFKANRTATITIVEHNFDVNRVVFTRTAAISGNNKALPSVSWVNSGDTHTATINYNDDGDYTFDVTMTDKAGNKEANVNYGSSVAAKDFTVDTTYSDIVKVEGIADNGVLGLVDGEVKEDAKISITINDINLDNYNIKLTRSRVLVTGESDQKSDASQKDIIDNSEKQQAENGIDVTSKFVSNASGTTNSTASISIPKRDDEGVKNDGLYTLTIEAKDKAGNAYNTNANIITFSVNRFGSVFTFSEDLYNLLNDNDGYTQSVASTDLTIYEYNATDLMKETVEVIANNDSKTLVKNDDYTVKTENRQNEGSWSLNTYNIKPENFKNDGVYTLRVSSTDKASITSQTIDYDVCSATFRVDSTPPDIISVNYSTEVEKMFGNKDKASAKTDELKVNFTVEDLIRLEKIEVYINGVIDQTYKYGEDFDDANTFDGCQFAINDGGSKTQTFKIVVTDKAGKVTDTSNKETFNPGYVFFDQLVVSPNGFAQFYANKVLFFGSIAGVVAITAGIVALVVVKKRKKSNDDQPEQA